MDEDELELPEAYGQEIDDEFKRTIERRAPAIVETEPVFHYASAEALKGIIETGKIWLSNASYLNDPQELAYPVGLASDVLAERGRTLGQTLGQVTRMARLQKAVIGHQRFPQWYTASFSLNGDDLSQWRAYCSNGGYSIGLDSKILCETLGSGFRLAWGRVEYEEEAQKTRITQLLDEFEARLKVLTGKYPTVPPLRIEEDLVDVLALAFSREFLFQKMRAFSSEREWRIGVLLLGDSDTPLFRIHNGTLVPYIERDLRKDGKLPLRSIHVCPLSDHDLSTHACQLLLRTNGYPAESISEVRRPQYRLR
jgi:hypothetical protein